MVKIDDIVGDLVFIGFRAADKLSSVGIGVESGHFLVKGFDQFGIWISHPGLFLINELNENGKPIPPDKQEKLQVDASVLVTWDNIQTIMHYPDREGFDFPSEFDQQIGFEIKTARRKP